MKVVISNSGVVSKPFLERISVIQGDVTQQHVDAIAMLVPQNLTFGGQINESIARACGHDLDSFILDHVFKPTVGDVYALPAFSLPVKHILVGIMPYYRTEFDMNDSHLSNATRRLMEMARCMLLTSVAFPPLGSGRKGFKKAKAARLLVQGITDRLHETFEDVRIVCSDGDHCDIYRQKLDAVGWSAAQ